MDVQGIWACLDLVTRSGVMRRQQIALWGTQNRNVLPLGKQPAVPRHGRPGRSHPEAGAVRIPPFPHPALAPSFASLLKYTFLRGPHTLLDSPLPSFSRAVCRHDNAGPFQGQGTVWNLSCTGWRLSGDLPMRPGETLSLTITSNCRSLSRRSGLRLREEVEWSTASLEDCRS